MQALAKSVTIGGREISEAAPVYIVAEMACGHQGSPEKAAALIDAAAEAEADAVQLELFDAPNNMAPSAALYETICRLQFAPEVWSNLFAHARSRGLNVFAFVYDPPSFELAARLRPDAYKLNSSDLSNPHLLGPVAASGTPYTLGTGASLIEEIEKSVGFALSRGGSRAILMHGVQSFPTPIPDADIGRVEILRRHFGGLVGYADHTRGDDPLSIHVDLLAIGAGACLVEKHIVLDRTQDKIDREAALEPSQFRAYVEHIRAVSKAVGTRAIRPLHEGDLQYRRFQKKVAVARVDIAAGDVLAGDKIVYLRHPEAGMSPFDMEALLGRRAARDIAAYSTITSEDLAG